MRAFILLLPLLSGCYGFNLYGDYTHLSSVPDSTDRNTTDQFGATLDIPLGKGRYAPRIELGLAYEIGDPVFGANPVGSVVVRQPLWKGAHE